MEETPIGSLGEGFQDRLLLEQQSAFDRAMGILALVLAVPFIFFFSMVLTALITLPIMDYCAEPFGSNLFMVSLLLTFAALAGGFLNKACYRFFNQVSLFGERLEADGAWVELKDIKVWPYGLFLRATNGRGWQVRCCNEVKLKTIESVLPTMVVPYRKRLEADHLKARTFAFAECGSAGCHTGSSRLPPGCTRTPVAGRAIGGTGRLAEPAPRARWLSRSRPHSQSNRLAQALARARSGGSLARS